MCKLKTPRRRVILTAPAISAATLWIAVAASSAGCGVSMRGRNVEARAGTKVVANVNQVRLRMRSLVGPICGEIERAADQIAAETDDPAVRKAAIRWKIDAVPTLSAALFQPDPHSAAVAVESCRRLEQQMADVIAPMLASGDVSKTRAFAKRWATEHPIRYAIPARETALSLALEYDLAESWSTGEAVAELTTSIDDFNRRLDVYRDHLFRQARWEAQLLGSELGLAEVPPLAERAVQSTERAVATLDRLAPAVERTMAVAEDVPALVASERRAAIDSLGKELTRTIAFLQEERIAGLKRVTAERIVAISALSHTVSEERKGFDRDVERIGVELVDHAMWRLAQLFAAVMVFLGVGAVAMLVLVRKLFYTPARA